MTQEGSGPKRTYEQVGMILWLIGSGAFIVSSYNSGDNWAMAGSILFFVGIVAFSKPLFSR